MTSIIKANAVRLGELHARIGETFKHRSNSPEDMQAWHEACERFHTAYDMLAFPGGYSRGLEKIKEGDLQTIATALDYLEHTPYCFRSQYVATTIRRAINKVALPEAMASRFAKWKEIKRKSRTRR